MDERSFEDRLRVELHEAAASVDPAPMPARVRSRARLRQTVAIAAVLIATVAIAGVTATVISGLRSTSTELAGGPEAVDDPRGSGGSYPCAHDELDGDCIAHGEYDGTEWWIGALMRGDDLCVSDLQEDRTGAGGGGMGCGPYDPDEIGLGISTAEDKPWGVASGEVSSEVERLVLERREGPSLELQLYPAPQGFPLDVQFYNLFLPGDPRALVAYDAEGNEIARHRIEASDLVFEKPKIVTPKTLVASGEHAGHPWGFHAREESINDDVTPCVDVFYGHEEEFGGGGSCDIGIPDKRPLGFSESSFGAGPDVVAVFGSVDARATRVVIELDTGAIYKAEVHPAPEGFRDDVSFFIGWVPGGDDPSPTGSIVAYDGDGNEVGRQDLCDDFPRGATCGT